MTSNPIRLDTAPVLFLFFKSLHTVIWRLSGPGRISGLFSLPCLVVKYSIRSNIEYEKAGLSGYTVLYTGIRCIPKMLGMLKFNVI